MPLYWSVLEPEGPVDLDAGVPEQWRALAHGGPRRRARIGRHGWAWVHQDAQGDSVWVLWADNGQRSDIEIWLPVSASQVTVIAADGERWTVPSQDGEVPIVLEGSARYSRTLMVLDQD